MRGKHTDGMSNKVRNEREVIDDYSLNRVPEEQKKSGWALSWLSMGIVSTLVQLLIGSYVAAVAGMKLAILADVVVAIFGGTLGWLVANVSFREGLSSTVTSRFYGFGARGSVITSGIFGFMILGFLALENALLYFGTLFALGWSDTIFHAVLIFGILTVVWIVLTTYGVNQVMKVSSYLLIAFLVLLAYIFYIAAFASGTPFSTIINHPALIPNMGSPLTRLGIAITTLAGSAGALALVDADYARYAKTKRDIPIMAYAGSIMMDIVTMIVGSVIVFGATGPVISYFMAQGFSSTAAQAKAQAMAQYNTGAYFIVLSSIAGFLLMYAAQAKAQVLNTYSGSLALVNFFDVVFKRRPGRLAMVILGNVVALIMIAVGILGFIASWLNVLGIITTSFAAVMIADYYIVRHSNRADYSSVETVNIAGVISITVATFLGTYMENTGIFPLGFLAALFIVIILYPVLRTKIFTPGAHVKYIKGTMAISEEE